MTGVVGRSLPAKPFAGFFQFSHFSRYLLQKIPKINLREYDKESVRP